jgi:hypothetical protein
MKKVYFLHFINVIEITLVSEYIPSIADLADYQHQRFKIKSEPALKGIENSPNWKRKQKDSFVEFFQLSLRLVDMFFQLTLNHERIITYPL